MTACHFRFRMYYYMAILISLFYYIFDEFMTLNMHINCNDIVCYSIVIIPNFRLLMVSYLINVHTVTGTGGHHCCVPPAVLYI